MSGVNLERAKIATDGGGEVSAEIARTGVTVDTAVILAHGAGSNMTDALLSEVHRGLAVRLTVRLPGHLRGFGPAVVKFNFEYSENRRRAPDRMPALEACYRKVVEFVRAELRPARLFLGGKSMGGRVASHLAAQGTPCDGLVFLGYPLHPAGKPQQLRTAHLPSITVPMLFFAGTRDALSDLTLLRPVLDSLSVPITLHVLEGADHSFKILKSIPRTVSVSDELCDVAARWIEAR